MLSASLNKTYTPQILDLMNTNADKQRKVTVVDVIFRDNRIYIIYFIIDHHIAKATTGQSSIITDYQKATNSHHAILFVGENGVRET